MKPFEEQFAAWTDGSLTGDELAAFEKELAQHPEAAADKAAAQRLGRLLRENPTVPRLANTDFFNLQIQERIAARQPRKRAGEKATSWFWSLPRLLAAGAACLLIAAVMFKTLIPHDQPADLADGSPYFAQVVESWTSEPGVSANTVYNAKDNVTVLWLDGLDYIPASYELN